jgi:predicted O-methyltransferase YrrM
MRPCESGSSTMGSELEEPYFHYENARGEHSYKEKGMPLNEAIRELEAQPFTHPTSVNTALGEFLYGLTKSLRPQLIVEIGCFVGLSTLHFAQALKDNGSGKIIGIDLFEPHPDLNLSNPLEVAEHYRRKVGFEDIITFKKANSVEAAKEIFSGQDTQIDLLFIDGDHSIKGVFADFNAYYGYVNVGGYVLLHDIYPERCGVPGPRKLLDHLSGNVPRYLEVIEIATVDGFGIALLRKKHKRSIKLRTLDLTPITSRLIQYVVGPSFIKILVRDAESKLPIGGASLRCKPLNVERSSNSDGMIVFKRAPPGTYSVDILAPGYEPVKDRTVKVPRNKELDLYVDLNKR